MQPTLFDAGGNIKTPTIYGPWGSRCDRNYLFSVAMKNQADAATFCCSIGMTLLRFETEAERQCLQEKNTLYNYDYMTWSNGIKDGSWTWCPDYSAIPAEELHWLAGEPSNLGGNEFCLQYALRVGPVANNVSKFRDIPCSTASLFICEGAATTTAAPTPAPCPVIKCTTDPTLFDSSGKIKTPTIYGPWGSGCGRDYLFSVAMKNQADAATFCCSIGMTLLRFETEAERQCLQEKNTLFNYDYMTWSNGIKDGSWTWCPDYSAIPAEELHWLAGEPSNLGGNEFCLQYALRVGPVANNVSKFRDIPCSITSYFICEGEATTTPAPTPAPCPVIKCTTDPTKFDSNGNIKSPTLYGPWGSWCGRDYMLSYAVVNQADAATFCCSIGMTLLRFETEAERQCVQEKNQNILFNYDYMTWSNGIKDGSWTWCPDNSAIPAEELHWLAGEPSNLGGNEFCLQYALRVGPVASNASKFRDIACSTPSLFICEGPASTTAAPG